MDDEMKIGVRGQVTIFIIVAIVIVVGIVGTIYFMGSSEVDAPSDLGPKVFIDKCVRDIVEESVETMLRNGGEKEMSRFIRYNGSNYNYLCYQADNNIPCYNNHPILERQIEEEIYLDTVNYIREECFNSMKEDFVSRGFDITGHGAVYSIDLLPGNIEVNLKKKFNISKDGTTQNFENFNTKISSPIYDLVKVVNRIVNTETQICSFSNVNYMSLHPKYDIKVVDYMGSRIYRVIDRLTRIEFRFAVRSCVVAPVGG